VNEGLALYRWLVVCRELDRALCAENPRWFPIEGEEATVVGTFVDLRPDDALAAHYRDPFVAYLMRGAEMWRLAAQVLGKGGLQRAVRCRSTAGRAGHRAVGGG
jgi:TPP-dependent pyruvate/acetoin dehydrogenase alpha subunit